MATNLAIDDQLITEAKKLGRHKTKKDAVNAALDEYVRRRKQQKIVSLFGTMDFYDNYDYKRERKRKRL
jgi:putative antitoxin of VapBC-like toxin-antitoxin system